MVMNPRHYKEMKDALRPKTVCKNDEPIGLSAEDVCWGMDRADVWQGNNLEVVAFSDLNNFSELEKQTGEKITSAAHLLGILYQRYGLNLPEHLDGTFAFCVTDHSQQRRLLVTDRFGIKPIVYGINKKGALSWALRIKILLETAPELAGELNASSLVDYLNLSAIPSPKTIYKAIYKLPPGHLLLFEENKKIIVRPYYDINYAKNSDMEAALLEELPHRIETSVKKCIEQNFRQGRIVGAFLSGGTDSSTVVGMLKKLTGEARAFAIGFDEPGYNELEYARLAASHFGAELYEYIVNPQDMLEAIGLIAEVYDEPFGNSSVIPTYYCAKLAKENGIDTLLAGDGGDEIFGGNERYAEDKVFANYYRIPLLLRTALIEPLVQTLPQVHSIVRKSKKFIRRANIPLPDRFYSYCPVMSLGQEKIFSADFLDALSVYDPAAWARELYNKAQAFDDLDRLLYLDMKFTITDNDLRKVTGMVESAGARVAYPLLDSSLVDFAASLPTQMKVRGSTLRYGFKKSLSGFLPLEIIKKQKHGFGLPIGLWSRTHPKVSEYFKDVLLDPGLRLRPVLKDGFVQELFKHHQETGAAYYGDILWLLLIAELWAQKNDISF